MIIKKHIISIFCLVSISICNSQEITKTDYTLVNIVVDSLVNLAYYDTIGLRVETLNASLSEDRATHPGSMRYVNGKFINDCPGNEITDSLYTKFNYEKFVSRPQFWDLKNIKNKYIISDFSLITEQYKERLENSLKDNQSLIRKDVEEAYWMIERGHIVHLLSTPIYSDKKDIGLILVRKYYNGLQSWQLRKNDKGEWYLFCIKQIEFE